jgi:hypothetical protein
VHAVYRANAPSFRPNTLVTRMTAPQKELRPARRFTLFNYGFHPFFLLLSIGSPDTSECHNGNCGSNPVWALTFSRGVPPLLRM